MLPTAPQKDRRSPTLPRKFNREMPRHWSRHHEAASRRDSLHPSSRDTAGEPRFPRQHGRSTFSARPSNREAVERARGTVPDIYHFYQAIVVCR